MKKLILMIFILILPCLLFAQTDCPFGFVNDPAPGSCARYINTNGNSICDLSEVPLQSDTENIDREEVEYISTEDFKSKIVKEVAEIYNINSNEYAASLAKYLGRGVLTTDLLQDLYDEDGLCAGIAAEIALSIKNGNEGVAINTESESGKNILPRYKFGLILITILILYLLSYLMVKTKKISLLTHRRLWNVLLLITFLASTILGLLLIIRINHGWSFNLPFNMLYWHVEFGTAMAVISFFHIAWHWRYFALMFKKRIDNSK